MKEHESKYEPLGHDESFKIMEEILAMQIGIDCDGVSLNQRLREFVLKLCVLLTESGG